MDYDKLEKLARGRVYTGAMAKKLGLVDEFGTLDDAVAYAAKLAGMSRDEKIERWILPPATSPLESLFGPTIPTRSRRSGSRKYRPDAGTAFARAGRKASRRVDFRPAGPRAAADPDAVPAPGALIVLPRL